MNEFAKAIAEAAQASPEFASVLKPIEAETITLLVHAAEADNPFIDSYNQVESHLTRCQALLFSCSDLRKFAHELELEAVKAVWTGVAVAARTETEGRFDEEFYSHRPLTTSEQYVAGAALVPPDRSPAKSFESVRKALADKRAVAVGHEQALAERRKLPGSAFNYIERHAAVRGVFTTMLVEAFHRARAASKGLKDLYGVGEPVPSVTTEENGFLDRLLQWALTNSQSLETKIAKEVEYDCTFWLRTGGLGMSWTTAPALSATSGVFKLTETLFASQSLVRIRALDVHVLVTPEQTYATRFPILLHAPDSKGSIFIHATAATAKYPFGGGSPASSNKLFNQNPIGQWTLEILDGKSNTALPHTAIQDIGINLRVASILQ